jgi:3',5'-cyclic AMP phosphodiesterase CpdA
MTFTLAHLSDPHLAPLPEPSWLDLIGKRITGYINWQRKRRFIHDSAVLEKIVADMKAQAPDHIAVTGDIANIALPGEFVQGREWLESIGPAQDVSFVPGNHDVYVGEAALWAKRMWGAFMTDDEEIEGFPYVRKRGPLAIIGVSTGVPTAPFLATGWIGTKQLTALVDILNQLKKENLFRVVLIHHPPVSLGGNTKKLLDAPVFMKVIATHGADLIIHGHDHIHMLNWLPGPNGTRVPAVGVPSASAIPGTDKHGAAYHLYRIDGTRGAWTCEVVSRGLDADGAVVEQNRFMVAE